ncbi:anoctamin-10-like [Engraulis encrasicolus]|uniref:anoctamin-10-like n=1 Tax=Engraulis encrasicolus TaxID=184585 RepID=UPI002FD43B71
MVLLKFHPSIQPKALDWLIEKISACESHGGLDLLCRLVGMSRQGEPSLVVGAGTERLLLEADEAILFHQKPYTSAVRLSEAVCSDTQGPSLGPEAKAEGATAEKERDEAADESKKGIAHGLYRMISSAEAVSLLIKILGKLEVTEAEEVNILPDIYLHPGEPVITSMLQCGALRTLHPVHEVPVLEVLERKWRATWFGFRRSRQRELLEDVRDYYGKPVALYFGFMFALGKVLLPKAVLSLCLSQEDGGALISLSCVVWSRLFLHEWKVKRGGLRADWGSEETMHRAGPHVYPPHHTTTLGPSVNRLLKQALVSVLFLTLTITISSTVMATYFYVDEMVKVHFSEDQNKSDYSYLFCYYIADILLSGSMMVLDWFAVELSGHLDSVSPTFSHALGSQCYSQAFLPEVIVFCLFNHFALYFYQALWLRELTALDRRITVHLATQCVLSLLLSLLLPLVKKWRVKGRGGAEAGLPPGLQQIHSQCDWPASSNSQTCCYLELLIIYCHVMLLSSFNPQCVVWCWVAIFLKSWLDTWRLGWAVCRPLPCEAPVESVAVWEEVFGMMEALALLGNTTLLQAAQTKGEQFSVWEVMQVAMGLQLLLLMLGGTAANVILCILQAFGWNSEAAEGQRHHRHYRLQRQQQHNRLPPQAHE